MPSLKELKDLIKLLRANGVTEYSTPELTLKVEVEYMTSTGKKLDKVDTSPIHEEPINPEDLLFYSSAAPAATTQD